MSTPTPGTIPALTQYQPGALPLATTVALEIVQTTDPDSAASYYITQQDLVGKGPSVLPVQNPATDDLLAFFDVSSGLGAACSIANLGVPAGNMPGGGTAGQFLIKNSATNFDATFGNLASALVAGSSVVLSGSTTVTVSIATVSMSTQVTGVLSVVNGGTGGTTFPLYGVVLGNATARFTTAAATAAGNLLIDQGTTAPALFKTMSGDATLATTGALTIASGAITLAKMASAAALSVLGNASTVATAPQALQGTANQIMAVNAAGTAVLFQSVSTTLDGAIGSTQGAIIYRNATSWVPLAVGTAGAFLQTQGAAANPQWAMGMTLLNTISPAQVASAVDTTSLTSRYSRYVVSFENVCPVSTALLTTAFQMQVATTGTAFISGAYISNIQTNVGLTTTVDGTTGVMYLSGVRATTSVGTTANYGLNGIINIIKPSSAAGFKHVFGQLAYITPGSLTTLSFAQATPIGLYNSSAAITGLNFQFQTGNISTGVIRIYGVA